MGDIRGWFLLLVLVFSGISCSKERTETTPPPEKRITVVFSPGGIGDMGYNDLIYAGFQRLRIRFRDIPFVFHYPDSVPQAEALLTAWLDRENSCPQELFVLAGSDYEQMLGDVYRSRSAEDDAGTGDILLFESRNPESLPVYTLRISTYGASYLAGITAAAQCGDRPALAVAANPYDRPVLSAVDGFLDGWASAAVEPADTVCMAPDWTGFIRKEEAYRKMYKWSKQYGFIFPVAGGTNQGIYKFLRENPHWTRTAGMDVDQAYLCTSIIGSVLKHIDSLVCHTVSEWIETGAIAARPFYGLSDGYAEWFTPAAVREEDIAEAVKLENEYEHRTENR